MNTQRYQNNHHYKRVNQYLFDLNDYIGKGQTSVIYRATNTLTTEVCALKAIHSPPANNKLDRHLLTNEAKALKEMRHPNILHAYDIMETEHRFYIATPLYGQSLEQKMLSSGKFEQGQILKILVQLSSIVFYLQYKGIVHRDICPSNIFENKDQIILGDFGRCGFLQANTIAPHFNIGLNLYTAPEALGDGQINHKSDIWSIGMTVLVLLHGSNPYEGWDYEDILADVENPRFPDFLQISERLRLILQRLLVVNMEQRISPIQLIQALESKSEKMILGIESRKQIPNLDTKRRLPRKQSNENRSPSMRKNQGGMRISLKSIQNITDSVRPLSQSSLRGSSKGINVLGNSRAKINTPPHTMQINEHSLWKALNSLSKSMLSDQHTFKSQFKLRLLKLIQKLTDQPFQIKISDERVNSDEYFKYVLRNATKQNIPELYHYFKFLLSMCLGECSQNRLSHDQNRQNRINQYHDCLNILNVLSEPREKRMAAGTPRSSKKVNLNEMVKFDSRKYFR